MKAHVSHQATHPSHGTRGWRLRWTAAAVLGLAVFILALLLADDFCRWAGTSYLDQRQHQRALRWLQSAAWLNFHHPETQFQLARVHRRLGQFDQFEKHWYAARRLGCDTERLQREQWIALAQTKQFHELRQHHWAALFEQAGSDGPEISEGYVTECLAKFRLAAAGAVLEAWQKDFPDDAGPYYLRGLVREASKNWVAAEQEFQQALECDPSRTEARYRLATALMKQLRFEEAELHLQRCLEERPGESESCVAAAECLYKLEKTNEARRILRERLDEEPGDYAALRKLGEIELAVGRLAEAFECLKKAVRIDAVSQDLRYQLATVLRRGGNLAAAQREFAYVHEANKPVLQLGRQIPDLVAAPDDVELRFEVAMTTWKYKSRDDGAKWFHSLLEFDPQHGPTHRALEQHYSIAGDHRRASYHRRLADKFLVPDAAPHPAGTLQEHWDRLLALNQQTLDHADIQLTRIESADNSAGGSETPATSGSELSTAPVTSGQFIEKTQEAGIQFTPTNGEEWNHRTILETLGVGIAILDYDGDGRLDVFCPGGGTFGDQQTILGRHPVLYRNEGEWRFTDVTESAGLKDDTLYSHGAVVADYDNDGFPDILVTGYGGLRLYHNQGDGTFVEKSQQAGLTLASWSTSAAWGDLDGDGVLDLYVVNYVDWSFENNPECFSYAGGPRDVCSPTRFNALPDALYFGNGDGTFRDESSRLTDAGKGLGVIMADLDLDGDLDIYVANDTTPNLLFRNDGRGNLTEIGLMSGTALNDTGRADGSMGIALGDFDLDGLPDLWVANFEDQSFALYRNEGDCVFHHVSGITGITQVGAVYVGFGTMFFDFDGDGYEDIFVTNGHVMHESRNAPFRQLPLLFKNSGGKRFINMAPQAGPYMSTPHMGRGVAVGDLDGDGYLDLAVSHTNEPISVLANQLNSRPHWIAVRLIGVRSNRSAIGARVEIWTDRGRQSRQIKGGGSYLSTSDPRLYFGLLDASEVRRMDIHWPSGVTQQIEQIPANQVMVLHEPTAPEG
jgi:enediyne biosynthesis protein E4